MKYSDQDYIFHQLPVNELHISLSRTVPLLYHWIEPITSSLTEKFTRHRKFSIGFSELAYYSNDEKTRYLYRKSV